MANKRIVTIEMDKERHIKFGINAMIELEQKLEKPLTSLGDGEVNMIDLRTMLFVGLKWEDKKLTEEAVGDIMDDSIEKHGMEYISEKLGEAITGTFGQVATPTEE